MSDNQLRELISEVRKLEGTNSANTRVVRDLQAEVGWLDKRLAANTEELRRKARRTMALVLAVGVLLAALTVAGIYAARYFSCRNDVTSQFLAAEHDKVAGQIRGVDKQLQGINTIISHGAPLKGLQQYRDGTLQFKAPSQHYLDVIDQINANC